MLVELFRVLGLARHLELQINSIGDATCRPAYRERLVQHLQAHRDALCDECRDRAERNPLRVLDCKNPACRPVLEGAPSILDWLCPECREHFDRVRRYLDAMQLDARVMPRLVRGFDYYVRTTFELITTELGAQNAVAGGGRYDGLVRQLGGPADPGIGFAIGEERVAMLLKGAVADARAVALLVPLGERALSVLLPLAQAARARGVRVELGYGERKLRAELERANRLGVSYAVIVGDTELESGQAVLRDMRAGEQRQVALDKLAEELSTLSRDLA
jgi:histidyl-tRNA synthetase